MTDVGKHEGVNRAGKQSKDGHINSRISKIEYSRLEQRGTNNYPGYCYIFFALTWPSLLDKTRPIEENKLGYI